LKRVLLAPCAAFEVDPQGGGEGGLPAAHYTVLFYYLKREEEEGNQAKLFLYRSGNFM
jgi:hypothetical protein